MGDLWFGPDGELIDPTELSPLEEVLARLQGSRDGGLDVFLWSATRWEQGLKPVVLSAKDQRLAKELLALPVDRAVVAEALQEVGAVVRARTVLQRVITEWDVPERWQLELWLDLQRRQGEVLWLLREVRIGVTGVEVQISISCPLPKVVPYRVFCPRPAPCFDDSESDDAKSLETWWNNSGPLPLRVSDDVGTHYAVRRDHGGGAFPLRVIVDGQEQAQMVEQYLFTFKPGVPLSARSLTVSGTIDLAIEQPVTESRPWPIEELALGDFSCTIDLEGFWPETIDDG